jgi:hypothetical protein
MCVSRQISQTHLVIRISLLKKLFSDSISNIYSKKLYWTYKYSRVYLKF